MDWAYEMAFSALAGGLIGARLDWVIQNWDEASEDLLGNVFSGSGLVWFGGLVGGAIGVFIWAWWRGYLGTALLDVAAPALALGYAVGRIGCQLSGDGDYGREWDGPWAMSYPDGTVPTTEEVHPTPVYETLAMGGVAYVLWRLRNRLTGGLLFALYLLLAGLERFLVEFIRRNEDVALGLTQAQLISVVDDPRRRHLARGRAAKAHAACPGHGELTLRPTAAGRRRAGSPSRSGSPLARSR